MKNIIFYFSGTGNALYVAREIMQKIENCELVNIAKIYKDSYQVSGFDKVGFIFPVYGFGAPLIVEKFISKLEVQDCSYLFSLMVHGGGPFGAYRDFKKVLSKNHIQINAGFELETPSNYISGGKILSEEESITLFNNQRENLEKISLKINTKTLSEPDVSFGKRFFTFLIRPVIRKMVGRTSKKFNFNEKCNSCGICARICPKELISYDSAGKPIWQKKNCEMCFSCINLCPQKAIEYGVVTKDKNRYKNPYVKVKDFFLR